MAEPVNGTIDYDRLFTRKRQEIESLSCALRERTDIPPQWRDLLIQVVRLIDFQQNLLSHFHQRIATLEGNERNNTQS